MATEIQQFTADGIITEFSFTFEVAKGGLVNVYNTLSGNTASEEEDIVSTSDYSLVYTSTTDDVTTGKVVFNTAPSSGNIITITPVLYANTGIDFTSQSQLTSGNLNLAFARNVQPLNYNFGLYDSRVVRYNINVNQSDISGYSTLLPALDDGAFWRRSGKSMIAQGYSDFVTEVTDSITAFKNEQEQVTISNQSGTTFSLSGFTSGDISQNTLDVYKNGLKLSIDGDYVVDSANSTITFTTALVTSDVVYVVKPFIRESNTFMDREGDNALITDDTLLAAKDLSNVSSASETIEGKISLATETELTNETNDSKAITPLKLGNKLREILSSVLTPVGEIVYFYGDVAPDNYLPIDGTHWSKTTYSELWDAIEGKTNVSSDTNDFWIENAESHFIRGASSNNILGSKQEDAIRNITGSFNAAMRASAYATGAFELGSNEGAGISGSAGNQYIRTFDASRVVPTANENRPINISYLICIKYTLGL